MKDLNIIIITGLSGSGKSTAIDALEDAGYFCVDNMPVLLLPKFLELRSRSASEVYKLALCMDLREKEFVENYQEIFEQLRQESCNLEILFLEASEEVLLQRFSQTRRLHPVSKSNSLLDNIRAEKKLLKGLKRISDKIIDTSHHTIHQLKDVVVQHANHSTTTKKMRINLVSFGFKYGIPLEADLLIDVRFIPNPFFIPELQKLDGKHARVQQFVEKCPETRQFLEKYIALLEYLFPLYKKEGKSYVTLGVGCTGGRHRSVTIAERIVDHFKNLNWEITLIHRDIEMD